MAATSQNFSIAEKFAYIFRETQTRMDLLISMNKDSPESVGKQSQAKAMQVTTDTSDTFDTSNPTTSTDIQALLQAQTNQFTSQINKLTNQFHKVGRGGGNTGNTGQNGKIAVVNGQTGKTGTPKPTNTNKAPTVPSQSLSTNLPQPITRPGAVNKFILGNFHKLINDQPVPKDATIKTDDKQVHPSCDPANYQDIIDKIVF
jgi:hypothetical protein